MFQNAGCVEIVSLLWAVTMGADGACIDLGMSSLLTAIGFFIFAVFFVSLVGGRIVRRILATVFGKKKTAEVPENGYESPVKSTGAWGRKFR